jgi:hypothetical protein
VNKLLNLRVALMVIAALLGVIGIGNAFVAVFFQSKYELVYNYDVTVVYCTQGQCAYSAALSVANTGRKTQDRVTVTITGLPPGMGGSPSVTNISAAAPRTGDPEIQQDYKDGTGTIQLDGLTPGTLVEFTFRGSFPEAQLPAEGETTVKVNSKGKQIEGDPRAITFGRYIS